MTDALSAAKAHTLPNFYQLLVAPAADARSPIAIETAEGREITYSSMGEYSARIAHLLQGAGIRPGDRVAVQVEKSPEAVFLYLACLRAGAVYLPINTAYTREETKYFLDDAQPKVVVSTLERHAETAGCCPAASVFTLGQSGEGSLLGQSAGLPAAFPPVPVGADGPAAILYSSGTTGKPKGVVLTHGNLASNAATLVQSWGFTARDVLLHALPLFHVHGLFVALHCSLLSRSRLILMKKFDAAQVAALLPRASVFMGVPTYYTRLLAEPQFRAETCRGMRLFVSGSAPLLAETFNEFQARTGHTILERYGMTETLMNTGNPLAGPRVAGTVGPALAGIDVRISGSHDQLLPSGTVGEIQVRGPNVFRGYWRKPDASAAAFTADGFFRTGDLGTIDQQGYVSIFGRSKDLIICGGYNVYPKEVEDCIDRLEGVLESAVIGMPHPDFGEAVVAVVVARPGAAVEPAAIKPQLRTCLANYKLPKLVLLTPELPRNTMGKVQKNRLRESALPAWQQYLKRAKAGDAADAPQSSC